MSDSAIEEHRRLFPVSNPSSAHAELNDQFKWKLYLGAQRFFWGSLLVFSLYCGYCTHQALKKKRKKYGAARIDALNAKAVRPTLVAGAANPGSLRPGSFCWEAQRWLCLCIQGNGKAEGQLEFKVLLCLSLESVFYIAWLMDPKSYHGIYATKAVRNSLVRMGRCLLLLCWTYIGLYWQDMSQMAKVRPSC
jgi:hypothetical protein